jgi:glycerol-3-phosphate dehydrogenase
MNVAIALTAVSLGAVVANHVEVTKLTKNEEGKINGAHVRDTLTGEEWVIKARGVINATGAFTGKYSSTIYYIASGDSIIRIHAIR